MYRRFFSPDSFWNTPIGPEPKIDLQSGNWINTLFTKEKEPNLWISTNNFTIPVYEVDDTTPRRFVKPFILENWHATERAKELQKTSLHGERFENPVPIPDYAIPDPDTDAHAAFIDYKKGKVWDMWLAHKHPDGSWDSLSGMTYSLDGPGIFKRGDFPTRDGDSIHLYGPGRAAGVPIIAGLIMREEVLAGAIEHKLAFACWWNARQKYVWPPATWTDGDMDDGPPEGGIIQLDPDLNLDKFNLSPAAKTVAVALQKYGAVNVDVAAGNVIYAEGLYGNQKGVTWNGLLDSAGLRGIDLHHYRFLKPDKVYDGGLLRPAPLQRK